MNKIIIVIILTFGFVACQQNNNQETEVKKIKAKTKPIVEVTTKICTKDLKICPDGNSVVRNPKNNCDFDACAKVVEPKPRKKESMMCTADVKECPDGSFVGRDHYNNCKFKECSTKSNQKNKI